MAVSPLTPMHTFFIPPGAEYNEGMYGPPLDPAGVAKWLKSREGEEWSESHTTRVRRWTGDHWAGAFGGVEDQKSLGDWTHQYTPEPDAYLRMGGYIKELGDRYIYEPETVKGLCSPA